MSAITRLIIQRMSQTMTVGGFSAAISNLADDEKRAKHFNDAKEWVQTAIAMVRRAPGGEVYTSDEEVAAKIMGELNKRRTR